MKFIDKQLIQEELQRHINNGFVFTYQKLSNRFLDWLLNHYYCVEWCENYYDSEPVEYNEWIELQKTVEGNAKLAQLYREYESERIRLCTWQEPRFSGNWGMMQNQVDKSSKKVLKLIRNIPDAKINRIYFARKGTEIRIYFYGRDMWNYDLWFIFNIRKNVQ